MATITDMERLGYVVTPSFEADGVVVYRVEGGSVMLQVRDDDQATIDALADPVAHDERVRQQGESVQQTRRRWIRERRIEPPNVRDVT